MIKMKCFILGFSLVMVNGLLQAANIEDKIIMCNDCHGPNGVSSNSDIPTISGYSETSITDMLAAYIDDTRIARKGKFRHGDTSRAETDMKVITKALTEAQIEAIATHYAELPFVAKKQDFDVDLAEKGAKIHERHCVKCHEDGGSSADDDAGIIAGQWIEFLQQSFADYRSGARETDEDMKEKIDKLSDKQINALVHYYASQQ